MKLLKQTKTGWYTWDEFKKDFTVSTQVDVSKFLNHLNNLYPKEEI